jgi:hypothetical protein
MRRAWITTPPAASSIRLSRPNPISATDPAATPAASAIANSTRCQAFPPQASSFARRSSAARSRGGGAGKRRCSSTVAFTPAARVRLQLRAVSDRVG